MDAYNYIKNAIIEGEFEAGKRLTEEFLANLLQLSRTPIREALNRLSTEGLLISLKRGMAVRSYSSKDIIQIYDLRAIMEGYAAGYAAEKRTEVDLFEIEEINKSFNETVDKFKETGSHDKKLIIKDLYRYNSQFHEKVLDICDNPYLDFFISKVTVLPIMYSSFSLYSQEEVAESLKSHNSLIKAIRNKEIERAKIIMMEHIYQGRDNALEIQSTKLNNETIKEVEFQ